jgi:ADP-ribose pyrophosphatase YjhB (NUDIX family)
VAAAPRGNVVTVGYLAVTPEVGRIEAGTDADDARLWPVADVIDGGLDLAFDHQQILRDAVERARDQLEDSDLATASVRPTFTLSEQASDPSATPNRGRCAQLSLSPCQMCAATLPLPLWRK